MRHVFEDGGLAAVIEMPAGPRLAAALDAVDLSSLDGGSRVDALCALARQVSHQQARLLEAMVAVADRSLGVGFDGDEVAFALHLPRMVAQREVALARDLTERLPDVLAALRDGGIDLARARVFSELLTPVADDAAAREIAGRLLPLAVEWTASRLRARLLKEILIADPAAAKARYERSVAQRRISLSANDDTTACLSGIFLPPQRAAAAFERVDAIARGLKRDGEARTLDQLRADVFCDLLAGVSLTGSPVDRAGAVELLVPLSTLIGASDAPGQLAGYGPVVADIARQVAEAQAAQTTQTAQATRTAQTATATSAAGTAQAAAGMQAAEAGRVAAVAQVAGAQVARPALVRWRYRVLDADGRLLYHGVTRARPRPGDTTPPDMPRVLPCHGDPVAPGVMRIRPLTPYPPQQTDETARFPTARMRAWIAARDTTCRAPGCTAPARSCDVDHTHDHADGGPTAHDNLGLLCRHHRVS